MNIRKWTTVISVALGLLLTAGSTQAALLSFEDDDIDFLLDSQLNPKTSGSFAEDDVLVAIFEIPTHEIDGVNAIPAGQELTGVTAIQISSIEVVEIDSDPLNPGNESEISLITFEAYTGGLNEVLALGSSGASVDDGDAGEGAMLAMWFNDTDGAGGDEDLDINRTSNPAGSCNGLDDCITQASLGELYQVDGFAGDPDEYWTSETSVLPSGESTNVETVRNTNNTTIVADFNAALSTFFHNGNDVGFIDIASGNACLGDPGYILDGCAQITISGTVTGGQSLNSDIVNDGGFAHSDFDGQKYTVPEPSILGLLGIGLMGIFLARRRQRA